MPTPYGKFLGTQTATLPGRDQNNNEFVYILLDPERAPAFS